MKTRIVFSALLIMLLSIGITGQASARPYFRGGFYAPRIGVRIVAPIPAPVVVNSGYYGGYANGYCAPAPAPVVVGSYYGGGYYGRGYYNHAYYDHGYRGGYYRGSYGPRGFRR